MQDEFTHCLKPESYMRVPTDLECEECSKIGDLFYPWCRDGFHGIDEMCIADCPPGQGLTDLGEFVCAKDRYERVNRFDTSDGDDEVNKVYSESAWNKKEVLELREEMEKQAIMFL